MATILPMWKQDHPHSWRLMVEHGSQYRTAVVFMPDLEGTVFRVRIISGVATRHFELQDMSLTEAMEFAERQLAEQLHEELTTIGAMLKQILPKLSTAVERKVAPAKSGPMGSLMPVKGKRRRTSVDRAREAAAAR